MPSRRRFLLSAALASSLAGCTGDESSPSDSTATGSIGSETTETTASAATRTTTGTTATAESTTIGEPRVESPESDAVRWRVEFDDPIAHPPGVAADGVYVPVGRAGISETREADSPGALASLDAADGTPRWTTQLPAAPTGAVRVHEDGVYCTAGGSSGFYGLDVRFLRFDAGGTERWRTDPVDQFLNPLAFGDGRAYLATSDDALGFDGQTTFAVDLADGETRWSVETGDTFGGRYLDGSLLVAPGGGRAVAVRDAETGGLRWSKRGRPLGTRDTSFSIADGAVFAELSEEDGRFAALELDDGTERWRYPNDGEASVNPTAAGMIGDTVVGTEYEGQVFGLDVADGAERWTFDVEADHGALVVGEGLAFVGDSGALYALDPAAGTEQWRVSRDGIRPSVAADGVLFATGGERNRSFVAAFDASDGTERWSFETHENLTAPVVADESAYVGSENGVVRELGE